MFGSMYKYEIYKLSVILLAAKQLFLRSTNRVKKNDFHSFQQWGSRWAGGGQEGCREG